MPHFLEGGVAKQIIWNSTTRSTSIICLYHYGPIDICFTLCILTQYYIIYFIAKTVSASVLGRSFQLALLSLWHTPDTVFCSVFLSIFFIFGNMRCSRLILYISCPRARIRHFSKKLGSFHWRLVLETKNRTLGVVTAPRSPSLTEQY